MYTATDDGVYLRDGSQYGGGGAVRNTSCMYVYVCVCICVCMHLCMHLYMCIYEYMYVCIYIHIYIHVLMYSCMCVCELVFIGMFVHVMYMHPFVRAHTYAHASRIHALRPYKDSHRKQRLQKLSHAFKTSE